MSGKMSIFHLAGSVKFLHAYSFDTSHTSPKFFVFPFKTFPRHNSQHAYEHNDILYPRLKSKAYAQNIPLFSALSPLLSAINFFILSNKKKPHTTNHVVFRKILHFHCNPIWRLLAISLGNLRVE